jgi:hypothetical protein
VGFFVLDLLRGRGASLAQIMGRFGQVKPSKPRFKWPGNEAVFGNGAGLPQNGHGR